MEFNIYFLNLAQLHLMVWTVALFFASEHDGQGHRFVKSFWNAGAVTQPPPVLIRIREPDHPPGTAGTDHLLTRGF